MKRYALLDTDFISKTHSVQDVACAVFTIGVGTDQSLMPRKIDLCILHADGLRPLTCQVVVSVVFRIMADNVVVAFDFIVSVVLVILLIQQFA